MPIKHAIQAFPALPTDPLRARTPLSTVAPPSLPAAALWPRSLKQLILRWPGAEGALGILSAGLCLLAIAAGAARAGAQAVASSAVGAPVAVDSADLLQPGDEVRLRIWREPDLSGDFLVDTRGIAVLPKIGPTPVSGVAPDSLRAQLVRAYAVYLVDPSIEVVFLRRIRVLGAVRNPGLYPADPTMTLRDALALAGGATPDGNQKKLILMRTGMKNQDVGLTDRLGDLHVRSGDQIVVPERSWMSRNPGIVASLIAATVTLFIAFRR